MTHPGRCFFVFVILCLVLSSAVRADVVTRRYGTAPDRTPTRRAARVMTKAPTHYVGATKTAPVVDGKLDDAAWKSARALVLERTLNGAGRAAQLTDVRVLRDEKRLYVAFRCVEPLVGKLRAERRGHDGAFWSDDSVELFIGPDIGHYYHFGINAVGSTYDGRGKGSGWNCAMKAAAAKGGREWTAEFALPLDAIGGAGAKGLIANFNRNRRTSGALQESAWSPTYSDDSHVPRRFGKLIFGEPPAPRPDETRPVIEKEAVTILPAEGGEAVVRFDLSNLPRGTTVHRAELLVFRSGPLITGADEEAMVDIEIHPLFTDFKGGAPAVAAKPLRLRGPLYDRFDAADAVRRWVNGKPNGGFFFKTCPRLNPEGTCLDVTFDGRPKGTPPQVTGVKVFHRAGQTFVTWKEVERLVKTETVAWGELKRARADAKAPCRYRIYAHDKPITAATIAQAELVNEVGPLSCYNANARSKEWLIGQAMIEPDEIGELAKHFNAFLGRFHMNHPRMDRYPVKRFVIAETAGELPLGTGLCVRHPAKPGKRYYAVVSMKEGVENLHQFSSRNAPRRPVDETVGSGVPVRQGKGLWGPYFDYHGTRWVYVQWCGPPLAPKDNLYFNWSVLVPPGAGDPNTPVLPGLKGSAKVPAELYFHAAGYSYAQPGKKMLLQSIQLAPHDYPGSGWYGFNDAWGTLKSYKSGTVSNHTQRRIVAFLKWAREAFPIDPDQIISVGADGAASLALNFPDVFAYVRITGFDSSVLNPKAAAGFASVWGAKSPDIRDDRGRTAWTWAELDTLALAQAKDLPLFMCAGASWGRDKGYARGNGRFYRAMQKARQPLAAGWGWSGARNLGGISKYTGLWRGKVITRGMPIPAISNSTQNHDSESSGAAALAGYNWSKLKDEADGFSVTIHGGGTFDLTPRRLRNFKIKPNEMVQWTAVSVPGRRGEKGPPQGGQVKADGRGGVTIEKLAVAKNTGGLLIHVMRAK